MKTKFNLKSVPTLYVDKIVLWGSNEKARELKRATLTPQDTSQVRMADLNLGKCLFFHAPEGAGEQMQRRSKGKEELYDLLKQSE